MLEILDMYIGIDVRALQEAEPSGVGEYTRELLTALFVIDRENQYHLFSNSYTSTVPSHSPSKEGENVTRHHFNYPNKFLNASLRFFNAPKIDQLISSAIARERSDRTRPVKERYSMIHGIASSPMASRNDHIDIFFMPNHNFMALNKKIPLVLTIHDLSFRITPHFFSKKQRLWHTLVNPRALASRATHIIAQSNHTKNDLMRHFKIPDERITVVYPGIASAFFEEPNDFVREAVRRRYELPGQFILFLGTLEPRKNVTSIIEAFELLKRDSRFTDLYLVLAGKNPFQPSPNSHELADKKILRIGYVKKEDRPALMSMAAAFVYPSYYEGFGFPPLEAQAVGTPVVASHTSSLGEVLGNSALLIDPYNIEDLRTALEAVLTDQKLADNLRARGKENAARFRWDRAAKEALLVFQQCSRNL